MSDKKIIGFEGLTYARVKDILELTVEDKNGNTLYFEPDSKISLTFMKWDKYEFTIRQLDEILNFMTSEKFKNCRTDISINK